MPVADQTTGIKKTKPLSDLTDAELETAIMGAEGMKRGPLEVEKARRVKAKIPTPPPPPSGTGNTSVDIAPDRELRDLQMKQGRPGGAKSLIKGAGVAGTSTTASDIAAPGVIEARRANIAKTFADVVKTGSTAELQAMVTNGKGPDGVPLSLPQTAELRAVLKARGVR